MLISYWECDYNDFDEYYYIDEDGDKEIARVYGCSHPNGSERCILDNKWHDKKDNCILLDNNDIREEDKLD